MRTIGSEMPAAAGGAIDAMQTASDALPELVTVQCHVTAHKTVTARMSMARHAVDHDHDIMSLQL